jgi:hypothetical protein
MIVSTIQNVKKNLPSLFFASIQNMIRLGIERVISISGPYFSKPRITNSARFIAISGIMVSSVSDRVFFFGYLDSKRNKNNISV